jgi:hypothetical protein
MRVRVASIVRFLPVVVAIRGDFAAASRGHTGHRSSWRVSALEKSA